MMLKCFKNNTINKRVCIDFEDVSHIFEDEGGNAVIVLKGGRMIEVTQKYESVVRWWKKQQEGEDLGL
jgi:hypothetical protein